MISGVYHKNNVYYFRSKWYSNPHFRGTYSFQTPEAHETSAERILAEPLTNYDNSPILLFAGEATNFIHYGTVQGAVETGYREANRILNNHLVT